MDQLMNWLPLFNLVVIGILVMFSFILTSSTYYLKGRMAEWERWRKAHDDNAQRALSLILAGIDEIKKQRRNGEAR